MPKDIPTIIYGAQSDYKKLYYSNPEAALKIPVTVQAGFGLVEQGTALALNGSAAGNIGKVIPYDLAAVPDGTVTRKCGRLPLVQNSGAAATDLYVTLEDSYALAVGDDAIIRDNTTDAENLGAITAIDRTTYTHMAKVTVTTAVGETSFTTARFAYLAVEGYDTCVGIIEKTVDTGLGSTAKGALATMILGNCVLYTGMLSNVDSSARTDVSASTFGNYTYIK